MARVQELFHLAVDLEPDLRPDFLDVHCADDVRLRELLVAMLSADEADDALLDRGASGAAADLLGGIGRSAPAPVEVGPYRVVRALGEGGTGDVYLVERRDVGSLAALKVLRDPWVSPARRRRFEAERRVLARLRHPGIPQLYDAGALPDGTPWFAMEYVEGDSLTAYCASRRATVDERLRLLAAVCDAVRHAHANAVLHRDLKPANIQVTADGRVKLLDFGIAKERAAVEDPAGMTQVGLRLMTPAYAAPERFLGQAIDATADVWSLGVILYELLTGRVPFDLSAVPFDEAVRLVSRTDVVAPSVRARQSASAPPGRASWSELDALCLRALQPDPPRRYASVEALARDLGHYLAGEPLEARPDSRAYRARKFVGRHRGAVASTLAAVLALVTVVTFYTARVADARDVALAEAARTARVQGFMLDLFRAGDESVGPADSLTVRTLIGTGVREASALVDDPAVQAELWTTLGEIQRMLGAYAEADSLLDLALTRRRALHGPGHADVAASLTALGRLRIDQADYEGAEALIREAQEIQRVTLSPDHVSALETAAALGSVLQERGEYEAAAEVQAAVLTARRRANDGSLEVADALVHLAGTHFYAGRYETSDSLNLEALEIYRRIRGERHPRVGEVLINLGASQADRGHYAEAEAHYRGALDIARAWYGEEHPVTGSALTMLGRALTFQDRDDEAAAALEAALAIQERAVGPEHPRVASALNDLGTVALGRGRWDEAEARYARMAGIYRVTQGERHWLVGVAVSNLGEVARQRGDAAGAEARFREALGIFLDSQGPAHPNTAIARIKLGRVLLRQGRWAEAAQSTREGFEALSAVADASVSYLQAARADLVEAYTALGRPDEAERFRRAPNDPGSGAG